MAMRETPGMARGYAGDASPGKRLCGRRLVTLRDDSRSLGDDSDSRRRMTRVTLAWLAWQAARERS